LSVKSLVWELPPEPSIWSSKLHALPAGNTTVKSGPAAMAGLPG
jgi:hypothetical protein